MDEYEEEYIEDDPNDYDEGPIERAILDRLQNERLSYTYKMKEEPGRIVLQAVENEHYKVYINYTSMHSGKEYTKE